MIQPISGPPPGQPPGQGDNLPSGAGNQPLSSQQRTSLESLMTKVTSLTQQQRAELWAGIRHDIGLSGDSPLLSRHFPAAEHNLAQRLLAAQNLLTDGESPSKVFEKCGFNDYTTFYRNYVSFFGHPPSGEDRRTRKGS